MLFLLFALFRLGQRGKKVCVSNWWSVCCASVYLCICVCVCGLFGKSYPAVKEQKSMLRGSAGTLLSFCLTACVCFFCSFSEELHLADRDTAFSSIPAGWLSLWSCPLKHGCYAMRSAALNAWTFRVCISVCASVSVSVCVIRSNAEIAVFFRRAVPLHACQRSVEHHLHQSCEKMLTRVDLVLLCALCKKAFWFLLPHLVHSCSRRLGGLLPT